MTDITEPTTKTGLRIVSLEAENVKRLRAVRITPDGSLVVISGENGAGKSSVLDAIEMALAGKSAIPDEPIHRGKRKARTVVDLGELVVERTFTSGGSKLVVKDRDGNAQKSPQALLDALVSRISFDPLEFATMAPKDQDRVLRELVGVDFTEMDHDRQALYDERTSVNRDVKRAAARVETLPKPDGDVPDAEVSVAALLEELKRREAQAGEAVALADAVSRAEQATAEAQEDVELGRQKIAQLERELAEARERLPVLVHRVDLAGEEEAHAQAKLDAFSVDDPEETRAQLATVEETNRIVRQKLEREAAKKELDTAERKSRELTEFIDDIDSKKAQMLAAAEYPIPGLGLDDAGVTLDGLPFEQACTSAKIRASVAIGAALNTRLRVLIVRRGNDLDRTRLAEVAQMADELGLQLWVERIEDGGLPAVVIEDGEVRDG